MIGKTRQAEVFSEEDDDFVTFGAFQKADKIITKKRTRQAKVQEN